MKSTFRKGLMLTAILALAGGPSAWAACTTDSQAVLNSFGTIIDQCPDAAPVTGYIYAVEAPSAHNSGLQSLNIVCEAGAPTNNGLGLDCFDFAGSPGDGIVQVLYDFGIGNPGSVGCPAGGGAGANGTTPVTVQVMCNDGASLVATVGWSFDLQQFALDYAGPGDFSAMHAGFQNGPSLTSLNAGPSPSADNICVNVPALTATYSDCDQTSAGIDYTCPSGSVRPPLGRGQLYIREAPCGSSPDPRIASGTPFWALLPNQPDAQGNACNVINRPTTTGTCVFIGSTGRVSGVETASLTGWFQVKNTVPGAANDKVKIDHAGFAQGKLVVDFSTTNETSIVGFNVYSDASKLNGSLINAKGAGSNAYTFEVGRGALKGGKSVQVEAVKSDGTVEKTAPVALK
jgi:hypothetical protein